MIAISSILLGAVLCVTASVSCAWRGAAQTSSQPPAFFTQDMGNNRRVVVLPFEGGENNPQLASRVRQSFFSHFSPKKYYDVEPRDIDTLLDTLDALSGRQWSSLSPVELGRCFKADYLLYGRVLSTRRLFFIFYSQIALNVEIRLVETRRGRTVWKTTVEKRMQSGDVPLHPLSLVSAAFHTSGIASDERMQDLIERTCRELARSLPEPADEKISCFKTDIQVASFNSGQRAQHMAGELQGKGYEARVERVRINGVDWHRVLVGPYGRADAETARQTFAEDPSARPVLIYAR
ncbi:MAG: SPOR domain-containing protein [Deltaproteobacteria bacterium]|nr:SPOR domain-containing protein [Deltaproteobacteria bacterium]